MRHISADTVLVSVLTICALTTTSLVVEHEFFAGRTSDTQNQEIANWQRFAHGGASEGQPLSDVTLIVFSDFQCPYCRAFASVVDSIHAQYPSVRIVERSFPLTSIHFRALDAAIAAACAARSGKYWAMRQAMFANAPLIEASAWDQLAHNAAVGNLTAFHQCVTKRETIGEVIADTVDGTRLKIHATPTVILNGIMFARPPSLSSLISQIVRIKNAAPSSR